MGYEKCVKCGSFDDSGTFIENSFFCNDCELSIEHYTSTPDMKLPKSNLSAEKGRETYE